MTDVCLFCGRDTHDAEHLLHCSGAAGYEPLTHVRTTDPETSLAAAESQTDDHVTLVQSRVLELHAAAHGLTDEELRHQYREQYGPTGESSVRSRRNDLTLKGLIEDSGEQRVLESGRPGIVWRLTARGQDYEA